MNRVCKLLIVRWLVSTLLISGSSGNWSTSTWRYLHLLKTDPDLLLIVPPYPTALEALRVCHRWTGCALICQDGVDFYVSHYAVPYDFYEDISDLSAVYRCWSNQLCKFLSYMCVK